MIVQEHGDAGAHLSVATHRHAIRSLVTHLPVRGLLDAHAASTTTVSPKDHAPGTMVRRVPTCGFRCLASVPPRLPARFRDASRTPPIDAHAPPWRVDPAVGRTHDHPHALPAYREARRRWSTTRHRAARTLLIGAPALIGLACAPAPHRTPDRSAWPERSLRKLSNRPRPRRASTAANSRRAGPCSAVARSALARSAVARSVSARRWADRRAHCH